MTRLFLTICVGTGLGVTGAVLDPLPFAVFASVFGQGAVAVTEGVLDASAARPRAVAPGTPHSPAAINGSLKRKKKNLNMAL